MTNFAIGRKLPANRLLAALPAEALARLWPHMEPVQTELRQVIIATDEPFTHVWFPESGWVSTLMHLTDGRTAEVGLVGIEGMVGLPVLLRSQVSPTESLIQAPGILLRIGVDAFRRALDDIPALNTLLLRYAQASQEQTTQTAACNGVHLLEQRMARWLLMTRDRAQGNEFFMTHEFLALMLCVHRPAVTVAAGMLQRAGLIEYAHGRMRITDPTGLEGVSCECYRTVRTRMDQLRAA